MPRMSLHVPEVIAAEIKRRAAERGKTASAYLAEIVRREVADEWPDDYFQAVIGRWHGKPLRRQRQIHCSA